MRLSDATGINPQRRPYAPAKNETDGGVKDPGALYAGDERDLQIVQSGEADMIFYSSNTGMAPLSDLNISLNRADLEKGTAKRA